MLVSESISAALSILQHWNCVKGETNDVTEQDKNLSLRSLIYIK